MDTKAFSTRTEYRVKDNPKINGVNIIGLDMGYSGPKCFHGNGNFVFPNFCQKITGEMFSDLSKSELVYEDKRTGDKYCVGDLAIKTISQDDVVDEDTIYERNHYMHPDFVIKFRTALALALWNTQTDGSDVFLQTGLPPEYIKKDEPYLRKAIEGRHVFSLQMGKEKKDFDITLSPNMIDVMYQPMGSFWSVVVDNDGNVTKDIKTYMTSNIAIFDGGFVTLDKFIVKGKQLLRKDTNANLGMKRILEETRKQIQDEFDIDISIPAMQTCLKTGDFAVTDLINMVERRYSIESYLETANRIVREEAFDSIKTFLPSTRYLIMTGGTGAAWYEYFKERLKGLGSLKVVPGNTNSTLPIIYSNARGYYMYRLIQYKQKQMMQSKKGE